MAKFILEIDCNNSAFWEGEGALSSQVCKILRDADFNINRGNTSLDYGVVNKVYDINGNAVGKYYISHAD